MTAHGQSVRQCFPETDAPTWTDIERIADALWENPSPPRFRYDPDYEAWLDERARFAEDADAH